MSRQTTAKTAWKYVGRHLDDLADGRTLEPGLQVQLTEEQAADPHNQRLIDEGLLITADNKKED